MQDSDDLHNRIKDIMIDVMAVLYENNIRKVRIGAMMRLLGVPEDMASGHDDDIIELDEKFGNMLIELNKSVPIEIPAGTIFH
jgi:hypothetical protein